MGDLVTKRDACRLCGSARLICSLPLAQVPAISPNVGGAEGPLQKVVAPLDTYLCRDCGLIQLVHLVDPSTIYSNYLYRTAVSVGLRDHFGQLCDAVTTRLDLVPGDRVVEFGSNDGTLLSFFQANGMSVQGVDPAAQIAAEASNRGIDTLCDFFGQRVAQSLRASGPARAILANNVMANIDDLDDVLLGVRHLLADDGCFVFETQYALDVFENTLLDVIYHEHISCFSVRPVAAALRRYDLVVFDAERIPTKGGSIRFWIQRHNGPQPVSPRVQDLIDLETATGLYDSAYHTAFGRRITAIKTALHEELDAARATGAPVAAYGTSVGCAALIHQLELEAKLDFLLDDNPFKATLEGPGYALPVHTADAVARRQPAAIVILAWRYADRIADNHRAYVRDGGKFIVPLPQLRTITDAAPTIGSPRQRTTA